MDSDLIQSVEILRNFLSLDDTLSPLLSDAASETLGQNSDTKLRGEPVPIGSGLCGEIFDMTELERVIKRAIRHSEPEISIEAFWHARIREAHVDSGKPLVSIPQYFTEVSESDGSYSQYSGFLPSRCREPRNLLIAERIPPLPALVRRALIHRFCPKSLRQSSQDNRMNKDCLLRIYLGQRRSIGSTAQRSIRIFDGQPIFFLRNFELTLDMMEELEIPLKRIAQGMGESLALMHWSVECDARDVEFVFGSARQKERSVGVWLLDFNQVRSIKPDGEPIEELLNRLVEAFEHNDPYYPRPKPQDDKDLHLWLDFSDQYLATSHWLRGPTFELAQKFLERVFQRAKAALTTGPPKSGSLKSDPSKTGPSSAGSLSRRSQSSGGKGTKRSQFEPSFE